MTRLTLSVAAILFGLAACSSTPENQKTMVTEKVAEAESATEPFVYAPNGREEFVFKELSDSFQENGYLGVCLEEPTSVTAHCLGTSLPYDEYAGKKGYYTDKKPVTFDDYFTSREGILETGEKVHIVTSSKFIVLGQFIIPASEQEEIESFQPKPLVEGSEVMITGYSDLSNDRLKVSSQNIHTYSKEEIDTIKKVASFYPENGAKIADLLSTLHIKHDRFEGRIEITGLPYKNRQKSYLTIRIIVNNDGSYKPLIKAHYYADDWLFVNRYSIVADDYRWDSKKLSFKRDHSSGKIWEWNTEYLTDSHAAMLRNVATAKSSIIRFRGSKYYDDYIIKEPQKEELKTLLDVVDLME